MGKADQCFTSSLISDAEKNGNDPAYEDLLIGIPATLYGGVFVSLGF